MLWRWHEPDNSDSFILTQSTTHQWCGHYDSTMFSQREIQSLKNNSIRTSIVNNNQEERHALLQSLFLAFAFPQWWMRSLHTIDGSQHFSRGVSGVALKFRKSFNILYIFRLILSYFLLNYPISSSWIRHVTLFYTFAPWTKFPWTQWLSLSSLLNVPSLPLRGAWHGC